MDSQKVINLLTMCRKAGRLVTGFDVALEAIVGGSARHVLVASNVSPKTLKEVHYRLQSEGLDGKVKVLTLPLTIQEVGSYINVSAGVIAVCDGGFGKAFERLLQ